LTTDDREPPVEGDAVIDAIDDVTRAVVGSVSDEEDLLDELARVREERILGTPMAETIGEAGRPRALMLMDRVINRLSFGSSRLRRAFVVSLVEEGQSVTSVAQRLQVTHQRISAILRRSKDPRQRS
jgi:hypothetical protein